MANNFQKFLFNLSTFSPISFFSVIVWWIQCGKSEIMTETGVIDFTSKAIFLTILGLLGLFFSFHSIGVVKRSHKELEIVSITADSVKSNDNWGIGIIITYLVPFANLVLSDYNVVLTVILVIIVLGTIIFINTVWPNPILMLTGYHFYEISNADGGDGFPLISTRRSIKRAKSIKKVITVWDYFLIEVI